MTAFRTSPFVLALVTGLAFPVASAYAQDDKSWAGFNAGVYFGAGGGSADQTFADSQRQTFVQTVPGTTVTQVFTDVGSGNLGGDASGSVVDLFVGHNFQPGSSFIVGIQAEGTVFSDIDLKASGLRTSAQSQTTTTTPPGTVTTASATAIDTFESLDELRSNLAAIVRAGFLASPNFLIYAVGGASYGHFVVPDSADPRGGDRGQWEFGYSVGGGGEWRLNKHWSIRGEYRYLAFDVDRSQSTIDSQTQITGATTFSNTNEFTRSSSTDVNIHLGKIGIVYNFWGPAL